MFSNRHQMLAQAPIERRVLDAQTYWIPQFLIAVTPELQPEHLKPKGTQAWLNRITNDIRTLETFRSAMTQLNLRSSDFPADVKDEGGRVVEFLNPFSLVDLQRDILWHQLRILEGVRRETTALSEAESHALDEVLQLRDTYVENVQREETNRQQWAQGLEAHKACDTGAQRTERVGQWVRGVDPALFSPSSRSYGQDTPTPAPRVPGRSGMPTSGNAHSPALNLPPAGLSPYPAPNAPEPGPGPMFWPNPMGLDAFKPSATNGLAYPYPYPMTQGRAFGNAVYPGQIHPLPAYTSMERPTYPAPNHLGGNMGGMLPPDTVQHSVRQSFEARTLTYPAPDVYPNGTGHTRDGMSAATPRFNPPMANTLQSMNGFVVPRMGGPVQPAHFYNPGTLVRGMVLRMAQMQNSAYHAQRSMPGRYPPAVPTAGAYEHGRPLYGHLTQSYTTGTGDGGSQQTAIKAETPIKQEPSS
ncbi:Hypothetical predicted protein [Lecanosticta acicola]|uniref:Uncharacterized protein n=1 Tax=Lecanosticta acicola TaxID=111012 RepID=A0AAI8VVQ8_9PEZI|nr:Hypothetical predicted protein [Lecanosticta acicola]